MAEDMSGREPDIDARTLARYTNLARVGAVAEAEDLRERIAAAEERGDQREARRLRRLAGERKTQWVWLVLALVVTLIVLLALWGTRGRDRTGDDVAASGAATADHPTTAAPLDAFPAEQVADPADVLPPEAISYTCSDDHETVVTQVELDLNPDARYQYAYEAGGSRIAILTVVDSVEYDTMAESLTSQYEKDSAAGADVVAPKVLEGVADGAVVYGSTAIFRNGDDAGMLWANTLVDAGGEAAVTVEPDELETLARIAAPRM